MENEKELLQKIKLFIDSDSAEDNKMAILMLYQNGFDPFIYKDYIFREERLQGKFTYISWLQSEQFGGFVIKERRMPDSCRGHKMKFWCSVYLCDNDKHWQLRDQFIEENYYRRLEAKPTQEEAKQHIPVLSELAIRTILKEFDINI